MLVKENTISPNRVAARPPTSNANRADQPTNRRRRRILVIGSVIVVLGLFFGIRYWMYASTHEDTDDAYVTGLGLCSLRPKLPPSHEQLFPEPTSNSGAHATRKENLCSRSLFFGSSCG